MGAKVAVKRKATTKTAAKARTRKAKPKPARATAASPQREVHYSDLRKVMLASVLKRLT